MERGVVGIPGSARTRGMTVGCSVAGTEPMPMARAASIRFCTAGITEFAGPFARASASTTQGTSRIASARPAAGWKARGRSAKSAKPSSCRFAHHASR